MRATARMEVLYALNAALLITHEIDSAFWKEWTLFGIPGGVQVFLLINFPLVLLLLVGFRQVVRGARSGLIFSLLLALSGMSAFFIHGYFLLTGHPEFTLPLSRALLLLLFLVSLAQGVASLRRLRKGRRRRSTLLQ